MAGDPKDVIFRKFVSRNYCLFLLCSILRSSYPRISRARMDIKLHALYATKKLQNLYNVALPTYLHIREKISSVKSYKIFRQRRLRGYLIIGNFPVYKFGNISKAFPLNTYSRLHRHSLKVQKEHFNKGIIL